MKLTRNLFQNLEQLFFPDICVGCGTLLFNNELLICFNCLQSLPETDFINYPVNPIAEKLIALTAVRRAIAFVYFDHDSSVQSILHELKYRKQAAVGILLGQLMGQKLLQADWIQSIQYIVPVPLYPAKEKIRGFNQSAKIAEGIASFIEKPVLADQLVRIKNTSTQTHKTKKERNDNVQGAFYWQKMNDQQPHILLIDDVFTTGATIQSCIQAILQQQECIIYVATFAYAME